MAKRLELLGDTVPRISRVAILVKPDNPFFPLAMRALEVAADASKIRLHQFEARGQSEFVTAFSAMSRRHVDAAVILEDAVFVTHVTRIAEAGIDRLSPGRMPWTHCLN